MGKKPKEKHILILIEGSSEQTIFEMSLPEMFDAIGDDYNVHFAFICEDGNDVRGDITSKHGVTPDKIEGLISKLYVGHVLEVDKFYARDISEIIHIIDLDGAYIPNENIVQGDNPNGEDKPFYTESTIINRSVSSIEERNKRKRDNIAALLTLPKGRIRVWHNPDNPKSKQSTIPYSLYYFSTAISAWSTSRSAASACPTMQAWCMASPMSPLGHGMPRMSTGRLSWASWRVSAAACSILSGPSPALRQRSC